VILDIEPTPEQKALENLLIPIKLQDPIKEFFFELMKEIIKEQRHPSKPPWLDIPIEGVYEA
jgi:hypothetical protein